MTDKTTTTKRRSVSKARLYKELVSFIEGESLSTEAPISAVLNSLKEAIVTEAIK